MPHPPLLIRRESAIDVPRINDVVCRAFGRPEEARLVEALRRLASPFLGLVAVEGDRVVGHVALSPVVIEGAQRAEAAAGLAPLGVLPECQRRGIGHALMRSALVEARATGWRAIFLLGNPRYYARFGFELAAPRGLHYATHDFDSAFQCLETEPGTLDGLAGWVRFHDAFAGV